ncbi:ATP-binding cassette domain-containing protein [Paracoccus kondratievae]|uniref:ABC transporter ATP-binding protein n=1 Tax=Paracoccus TaxID=265 RepID=UPI000A0DD1FB|nr:MULTISPECIES: oligopeptide/dipeptide ABC transporter ATP-binding protein [Paracoccus]QFQ88563.1 ATP-binding cassette domain-containing protein [Paracoccus kondratievae]SMG50741.1 peptide/nickel transport system ATP-binding protein [Paracoccus sp. J56]
MSQLLSVRDLRVHFPTGRGGTIHAVDGVSFDIPRGQTLGIVGESGSGKTTTALAVMRLAPITSGKIDLDGIPISRIEGQELRRARPRFQMVFQDPFSSLNPRDRVGRIIRQPMDLLGLLQPPQRDARVEELLAQVGLRPELKSLYPHQFSGGQRQRIGLARALATKPDLIVFDEPVSALDVAVQAQVLNLIRRLQRETGLTYLFISHDLGVVRHVCDEIAVMYLGRIVEKASAARIFASPRHPYTQALIAAAPSLAPEHRRRGGGARLQGDPPSPVNLPPGCPFASRCPIAVNDCRSRVPTLRELAPGQAVACHLA